MSKAKANFLEGLPKSVREYVSNVNHLEAIGNNLVQLLTEEGYQMRGLSLFPSNSGGWCAMVKIYRGDGQPIVQYSNGDNPAAALFAVEPALQRNKWRVDYRAEDYDPSLEPK